MRLPKRIWVVALSGLLMTACGSSAYHPGTSSASTDTFRIGTAASPSSLNPLMGHEAEGTTWFYDGLLRLAGDQLEPALAASLPAANADATVWTVTIRPGVLFSDGSQLDAADVVATYQRVLDPSAASPWVTELTGLAEVTATAADTVQFRLNSPNAFFGDRLTVGIIPSEIAAAEQGKPLTESSLNDNPVGTGPYQLDSWADRNDLVLKARTDWWGGAPQVTRLVVTAVPNDATRAQMVFDATLDGTQISPAQAASLLPTGSRAGATTKDAAVQVVVHDTADTRAISLPMDNPLTVDPLVRRALNLAVDRQGLVDGVLKGYAIAVGNPFPHSVGDHAQAPLFSYDPDEARRLLDEAGWLVGSDGSRMKDGQRATLTIMYPSDDVERRDQAQVIVDQLGQVGIEAKAEGLSWDLIEPRMSTDALVFAGGTAGNPDATAWNWMACELAGEGFNNPGHYCNPQFDQAMIRARSTTDPAVQQAAYAEANQIFAADPGYVFLNTVSRTYLLRPGAWQGIEPVLEGHVHSVSWGPWWDIAHWTR